MSALADTLRRRCAARSKTVDVDCGTLGVLRAQALSPKEFAALRRGEDGDRAVLYAACRELQLSGEELRREGKVFTPDEIMQFVSDEEAAAGAAAVGRLSGMGGGAGGVEAKTEQALSDTEPENGEEKPELAPDREEFPPNLLKPHSSAPQAEIQPAPLGERGRESAGERLDEGSEMEEKATFGAAEFGQALRESFDEDGHGTQRVESEECPQIVGIGQGALPRSVENGMLSAEARRDVRPVLGEAAQLEAVEAAGEAARPSASELPLSRFRTVHQSASEMALETAQCLLEGLRAAAQVR